jgi:hypothetical protein|tara:strand:- start:4268 stop:4555 length:288 start_codon:yes stop_codon:yes gene_type:complete
MKNLKQFQEDAEGYSKKIKAKKELKLKSGTTLKIMPIVPSTPDKALGVKEEAPPGKKYERMIKHIKRSYAKDGKLTKDEKSIAYATAWKHKNKDK